jgi:hypothetical protein
MSLISEDIDPCLSASVIFLSFSLTNVIADASGTADAMASILLGIGPLPTTYQRNNLIKRFPPVCRGNNSLERLSNQETLCERNLICHTNNNVYKNIINFKTIKREDQKKFPYEGIKTEVVEFL